MIGKGGHEEPPIVQYWHEEEPPGYIADLLETFSELNPERRHLVFNEATAGAFIGERFEPRHLRAFQACAVPAMQSDYLRYCAVLALGGAYCDADARCIASLSTLFPPDGCGHAFLRPDGWGIHNGLFAFGSPGSALLELTLEIATVNIERRIADSVYGITGPLIFTLLYRLHRLGSFDALLEHMATRRYLKLARVLCETIDDYDSVGGAFEGVRISSISENGWLRAPQCPLPYKETEAHWMNVKGEIYRRR